MFQETLEAMAIMGFTEEEQTGEESQWVQLFSSPCPDVCSQHLGSAKHSVGQTLKVITTTRQGPREIVAGKPMP